VAKINQANKQAGGGIDRENFNKSIFQFHKLFREAKNSQQIKDVDPAIKEATQRIFEIQTSFKFRFCDLISERLDAVSRVVYIVVILLYLHFFIAKMTTRFWAASPLLLIAIAILVSYFYV